MHACMQNNRSSNTAALLLRERCNDTHTHTHNSSQPREGVATCREGGATCREVPRFAKLASVLRRAPPDAIARGLTIQMGDLDRVMEGSFGLLGPCAR